jgi:outer membrane protein assembly factor BamB
MRRTWIGLLAGGAVLATLLPGPRARAGGGDWEAFGGPGDGNAFTLASDLTAPAPGDLTLVPRWVFRADGRVTGAPVASDTAVFFTTRSGAVWAVDRATGHPLWVTPLPGEELDGGPLLDGGRLFVAAAGGRDYALDPASGRVLWQSAPLFPPSVPDALRAAPKASGGVVYQSIGGQDDAQGEHGGVAALDEATGRLLWERFFGAAPAGGAAVFGPPAIVGGTVIVGTGNPTDPAEDDGTPEALIALDGGSGAVRWQAQTHSHDATDADFLASPNVFPTADGTLAVGDGEKDGHYYAFAADGGAPLWQADLSAAGGETLVVATAAAGGGRVFVGTMDVPSDQDWGAGYQSPNGGRFFALDATTGAVDWSRDLGGAIAAAPVVAGDLVFVLNGDGDLYALNTATGATVEHVAVGGTTASATAALALAGDLLLVPTSDPGGVQAWQVVTKP